LGKAPGFLDDEAASTVEWYVPDARLRASGRRTLP
jgi:hypothetical protein